MKKKLTLFLFLLASSTQPTFAAFAGLDQLGNAFSHLVNAVAILAGFVALIFIALGAVRYMISQGDPKAVSQARATLFWAIAGLIFIVSSYLIINFLSDFTGLNQLKNFCIPTPGNPCP